MLTRARSLLLALLLFITPIYAAANGWAPVWNPSGTHVASGLSALSLDGVELGIVGWGPRWISDDEFVYTDADSHLAQYSVRTRQITVLRAEGFNDLAAGGGRWVGWRPDIGLLSSDGFSAPTAGNPAVNVDGKLGYIDPRADSVKRVIVNGQTYDGLCACGEVSISKTLAVWTRFDGPQPGTWFKMIGGLAPPQKVKTPYPAEEYVPIAIDTPEGPWVGNFTQTGIIVRPASASSARGYRFDNGGQAYLPAFVYRDGAILAAFSDERGVLSTHAFPLNAPRVDLSAPPPGDVEWTGTTPVDLTPFIIGDANHWPRTGSHDMDRAWDGRNLYWLKFGVPDHWERWVLDGDSWYLREDRSQSGAGDYSFHPGRWFPRVWTLGSAIVAADNAIQRYDPTTCAVIGTSPFPYTLRFAKAWSRLRVGGSIGTVESTDGGPVAVLLEYDPGSDSDTYETGLFVKGWGSTRWQVFDQRTGALGNQTIWPTLGGAHVEPTRGCYRSFVGIAAKPTITISSYGPAQGVAPLTWEATAVTTGSVDRIIWRWRLRGTQTWTYKDDDFHTTVTFTQPGVYEIGVDAYGPGGSDGTASPRLITVTAR